MMAPHPTIQRRLDRFRLPRLRVSAGSSTPKVVRRRTALIDQLIDDGQVAVLAALVSGSITPAMLDDFARDNPLTGAGLAVLVRGQTPIGEAFTTALERMATGATRARYALSLSHVVATYGAATLVRDLPGLDWRMVIDSRKSAADAHHVRRAVSRFLSIWYGKAHPARLAVLEQFPPLPVERSRVPELTPDVFARIVAAAREDMRPALVVLVVTGLRVGEYLALTREHLRPATYGIAVPGTKTAASAATVTVDPSLWPVVLAAVPAPVRYRRFATLCRDAFAAAGVTGLRIHDLRHAHAQWAVNAGVSEAAVQRSLRHSSGAMTRKYSLSNDTRAVSLALAGLVKVGA